MNQRLGARMSFGRFWFQGEGSQTSARARHSPGRCHQIARQTDRMCGTGEVCEIRCHDRCRSDLVHGVNDQRCRHIGVGCDRDQSGECVAELVRQAADDRFIVPSIVGDVRSQQSDCLWLHGISLHFEFRATGSVCTDFSLQACLKHGELFDGRFIAIARQRIRVVTDRENAGCGDNSGGTKQHPEQRAARLRVHPESAKDRGDTAKSGDVLLARRSVTCMFGKHERCPERIHHGRLHEAVSML